MEYRVVRRTVYYAVAAFRLALGLVRMVILELEGVMLRLATEVDFFFRMPRRDSSGYSHLS
jgi:hypothetical protein